jgi:hypothetical protein
MSKLWDITDPWGDEKAGFPLMGKLAGEIGAWSGTAYWKEEVFFWAMRSGSVVSWS